jgi:ABC-type Fe3+/spermidine/putrescine transport system ATPase subunit
MLISAEQMGVTYRSGKGPVLAVRNASLEVAAGEIVAVYGPSGSGKTSLLMALGGLLCPDAGRVMFKDEDVYRLSSSERAAFRNQHIGFVFQQFHLIPYLTVLENVMAPALAATSMPSVATAGVRVRIPGVSVPGAMLTEVTPLGFAANSRSLILKFEFRAVAIVGPPAVFALKMTRSFTPGRPLAFVPARSVAKLLVNPLFSDQLPPPRALDQ